ncbi:MAG: hypothetical protein NZ765_09200 [Anaerolineae bacterium]|nr:hypothetical protein [Anaerolineae bacterium]MDW8070139.1 hypothetical protein [Anaerolineae bacterium]
MGSVLIRLAVTWGVICLFLVGCTRPALTPQATESVTAVRTTPRPVETPTSAPPATQLPTLAPTGTPAVLPVSIGDVMANPEAFRDRLVHIRGHGLIAATFPLCKGYVGLDRRTHFVDAAGDKMVAETKWQPPPNTRMYDPDNLRTFEGYIRVFRGEIGCPGDIKFETFPYFEVINVVE